MKFTRNNLTNPAKTILTTLAVLLTIVALNSCLFDELPTAPPGGSTTFQQDIENATTMPYMATANALTREVLEPLGAAVGALLEKRYVTETGTGSRNGSSWTNAWGAADLRNNINAISDASTGKVYLVMVAGGDYKPTYDGNRNISFSMKNHVAIMGDFDPAGGWGQTGTTTFSGDIGTADNNADNSYHVFNHRSININNAHLYGVTITGGNADGNSHEANGGGMYNYNGISPVLTKVVFSNNTAIVHGGGMYNTLSSSPVLNQVVFAGNNANDGGGMFNQYGSHSKLNQVVFTGNRATSYGGGMYNTFSSAPVLNQVVFINNSTGGNGGGMYNSSPLSASGITFTASLSVPVLYNTVFIENSAIGNGGGMYNNGTPIIIGAVFKGNSAKNGGGIHTFNLKGTAGPLIVNTVFAENTTNNGLGKGPTIAVNRTPPSAGAPASLVYAENIRIAGSVLGIGLANPSNAIVGYGGTTTLNISNYSLSKDAVNLTGTATITVNGMDFTYPTIQSGSSAINLGLYVRMDGSGRTATHYFSEDNTTWYSGFTSAGLVNSATPPASAVDLTATDITGKARTGRPDAGVYELP